MHKIYEWAGEVTVWLGSAADDSDAAMDALDQQEGNCEERKVK